MIQKITYASPAKCLEGAAQMLRGKTGGLTLARLLIVPDGFTLKAETAVFSGGGAFDSEVTTFSRLFSRLYEGGGGYLSASGAVMLLRSVTRSLKGQLQCFTSCAGQKGFSELLYRTFSDMEMSKTGFFPEGAQPSRAEKMKIHDLELIYAEYKKRIEGRKIDSAGRLKLLPSLIAADDSFKNADVHFALFDELSPIEWDIADAFLRSAKSVTVHFYDAAPMTVSTSYAESFVAPDEIAEAKNAAHKIRELAMGGADLGKIGIIIPEGGYGHVQRILTENEIPHYYDFRRRFSGHAIVRFLKSAFEAHAKGLRRRTVIELCKNAYSGVAAADADAFENYCNLHLVEFKGFSEAFSDDDGAERVRKKLMRLLAALGTYSPRLTAEEFSDKATAILSAADAERVTDELDEIASEASGAYAKAVSLLTTVKESLGGEQLPFSVISDCFFEGAASETLRGIPAFLHTVTVGTVDAFVANSPDYLFVLGANEGVLPAPSSDTGLFATADSEDNRQKADKKELDKLLCALGSCKKGLFVSYSAAAASAKIPAVWLLRVPFSKNTDLFYDRLYATGLSGDTDPTRQKDIGKRAAYYCSSKAGALEFFLLGKDFLTPQSAAAYKALGKSADAYLNLGDCAGDADALTLGAPFIKDGESLSVSRLQSYFSCPYRYFLQYVIGAKKREDGLLSPADVGNFIHAVLERFDPSTSEENIAAEVEKIVADLPEMDKYRLEENKKVFDSLKSEAVLLCRVVARQSSAGSFRRIGAEIRFGEGEEYRSPRLGKGGRVGLRGSIDRADAHKNYATVIDYKTGSKSYVDLTLCDIYYGKKVQLFVYAAVLKENGFRPVGMFYFPATYNWQDDENSFKLRGRYIADPEIMKLLDGNLAEGQSSSIIPAALKKDGMPHSGYSAGVSKETLDFYIDYSLQVSGGAIEEISEGFFCPAPLADGKNSACSYCDFLTVCNDDAKRIRYEQSYDLAEYFGLGSEKGEQDER